MTVFDRNLVVVTVANLFVIVALSYFVVTEKLLLFKIVYYRNCSVMVNDSIGSKSRYSSLRSLSTVNLK